MEADPLWISNSDEIQDVLDVKEEFPSSSTQVEAASNNEVGVKKIYKCKSCGKVYKKYDELRDHIYLNHMCNLSRNVCPYCPKVLLSPKHVYHHQKSHPESSPDWKRAVKNKIKYTCSVCAEDCANYNKKVRHDKMFHSEPPIQSLGADTGTMKSCIVCKKVLDKSQGLKSHSNNMHGRVWSAGRCRFCSLGFESSTFKEKHMIEVHKGVLKTDHMFTCPRIYCHFMYVHWHANVTLTEWARDRRLQESKSGIFDCLDCPSRFHKKESLKQHLRIVHVRSGKGIKCNNCCIHLSSGPKLLRHIRTRHIRDWPNVCKRCQPTEYFVHRESLVAHLKTVHGIESEELSVTPEVNIFPTIDPLSVKTLKDVQLP